MTDIPTIAALPAPPQRGQDAALFVQRADAFIDALAGFVAQLNAFGAQLVAATQERVVNEAGASFTGAAAARDAAIAARDAAQGFAASINPATLVKLTGDQAIAGTKNFTGVIQLAGAALALAATYPEAATADMLANVDKRLLSVRATWNALVPVVLADAATIALDLNAGIHFTVTVAGNRTLAGPTNAKPGQEGFIRVVQDATGSRALSFAAAYKFPDGATAPSLNTVAGAVSLLRYHVSAAGEVFISGGRPASGGLRVQTISSFAARASDNGYIDVLDFGKFYTDAPINVAVRLTPLSANSDIYRIASGGVRTKLAGPASAGFTANYALAAGDTLELALSGIGSAALHIQQT